MGDKPLGVVAQRFRRLQATIYPDGGQPLTLVEIADGINALAGRNVISRPYLSQIRSGDRPTPSHEKLAWIAKFFGVPADYFSDDTIAATVNESLDTAHLMRDHGIHALALRAQGMTPDQLREALTMLDWLRQREGLPGIPTPDPDPGQRA